MGSGKAKKQDTHGYVVNSLGARIASGEISESTVLTLSGLEEEYEVSHTVIREAVRVLESHGMLVSRRRVGVTVQPISNWDVLDESVIQWRLAGPQREQQLVELMELRSAIEPTAARFAAERASYDQRGRLKKLAATLETLGHQEKGNSDEFLEADIAFHTVLIEASCSPLLVRLVGPITEVIRGRSIHHMLSGVPEPGTLEGHLAVASAVDAGDGDWAASASALLVQIISSEIRHR